MTAFKVDTPELPRESGESKRKVKICVVGSSTHFLSGITYYTYHLCNSLSETFEVCAVLMRQLLPTRLYPGRSRVGAAITSLRLNPTIRSFDGVDWFWIPSMVRALAFLHRQKPEVVVFQWWTGTVFHSYLVIACATKVLGARLVIEFHEVQDTGELRIPLAGLYGRSLGKLLVTMADGFVVHSNYDRAQVETKYGLHGRPVEVVLHGPYNHYRVANAVPRGRGEAETPFNVLFFGTIRPFKGLEDLIAAFDGLPRGVIDRFRLTVVGETWEGWTLPIEMIERSRYRDRITLVNYYVTDEEVAKHFEAADLVVLPYHRSSASGPLHIAMSLGLPIITTSVGGLGEAASNYEGVLFVPPHSADAILESMIKALDMRGRRFTDPHSWERTVDQYAALVRRLLGGTPSQSSPASFLASSTSHRA